ncbi:MAG: efflux transporter outer membrane subunit [Gammaproteobacteria bacterium]|nr:efflux transporter outer membrane subunit [Gammaproteobacteria bacterium]
MRKAVTIALLACGVAACAVGPDYHRPEVDTPKAYRFEPQQVAAEADLQWWKQFGDPVLDALVAEALANNWNVKIAAANVEQAAGVLTTARAPLFPQVGYDGTAARARFSENGTTDLASGLKNPTDVYQVLAGASWEIDLWGRIRRLTEAARAELLATEAAKRGVVLSLVGTVATSYLQLRGLDQQLEMAERTQAAYAESLRVMELKFEHGRVSQMNVDQARARYETAAARIPAIRRDIAVLENGLSVLLGRTPGPIPRGKSIFEISLPAIPPGVPSDLLERRPDLQQAEQQLIAANAQIGAAKAQFFPAISLTGAIGSASTDLSNLFKGPAGTWNYGGGITGPIFSGGAIYGQYKQAKAAEQAALAAYQLAIRNAFADVDNALVTRTTLDEQVAAQSKLVESLRSYEKLAKMQFDVGRAPYSTVLQAQQQLFPAELEWAAARAQLCASLAGIYKSMGGGWVAEAEKMSQAPAAGSGAAAIR